MDWPSAPDAVPSGATAPGATAPGPDASGAAAPTGGLDVEEYRALLRSAEQVLEGVDRALVQLRDGTYGTCASCGEPIEAGRLDADPLARHCAQHDAPGAGSASGGEPDALDDEG